MHFIDTNIGLINLAHVVRIRKGDNGFAIIETEAQTGTSLLTFEAIQSQLGTVIPNTTECEGLFLEMIRGEVVHSFAPIIGWRIGDSGPDPVMPSGDRCDYIVFPNGRVDQMGMTTFESVEDAIRDFRRSKLAAGGV